MHHIAVKGVAPGGHRGQALLETIALSFGMQMPHQVHLGHANHVKVHQVVVVGQQVVRAPVEPARVFQLQNQSAAILHRGLQLERLKNNPAIESGL